MSTLTIIVIVALIGAILVVGLLWYKQKQEANVLDTLFSAGVGALTKL